MIKNNRVQQRMEKALECTIAFEALIDCTDVVIPKEGILAGPVQLNFKGLEKKLNCPAWQVLGADNQHFAMNMDTLMKLGFAGIAREARKNAKRLSGEESAYLEAIARCYEAAMAFVAAHADEAEIRLVSASGEERQRLEQIARNCRALSEREPRNFFEAVQLSWFGWCMRRYGWGGTIGRLDQHLYPFYRADLEAGRLTREAAFELLVELWQCYNRAGSGDTLTNLMLGGQDRNGNDVTNEMSYLMIDVALAVRKSEPHLSVRVHSRPRQKRSYRRDSFSLQGTSERGLRGGYISHLPVSGRSTPKCSGSNHSEAASEHRARPWGGYHEHGYL